MALVSRFHGFLAPEGGASGVLSLLVFPGGGVAVLDGVTCLGGALLAFAGAATTLAAGAGLAAVVAAAADFAGCFFWKLSTSVSVPPSFMWPGSGRRLM